MREKKEINVQIGEQVKIAREQAKITQELLAEKIAVSPQYISDLERGVVGISIPTLKNLCIALHVSSDQIIFAHNTSEREMLLSRICNSLTDDQFTLLLEMLNCYIRALTIK